MKGAEKRNNISASVTALTTSVACVRRTNEKSNARVITFLKASFLGVTVKEATFVALSDCFQSRFGRFSGTLLVICTYFA